MTPATSPREPVQTSSFCKNGPVTYSEKLRSLSAHCGVATSYTDYRGSHVDVADETLENTLHALGPSFSHDDAGIDAASEYFYTKEATRSLPPTVIGVEGEDVTFPVHVIDGEPVDVWVVTEDGERYDCQQIEDLTPARHVDYPVNHAGEPLTGNKLDAGADGASAAAHASGAASYGQASFTVPKDLPLGWHTIYASSPTRGQAETTLIITPSRLSAADDLGAHPQAGLMAQLYSVRDSGAWGIGDFYTLGTLARHAAEQGSSFILANPLHAAEPAPPVEDSPYLPTTRRYINPIYIRPGAIPEAAHLPDDAAEALQERGRRHYPENTSSAYINRNPIYTDKLLSLKDIYDVERSATRQHAFDTFVEHEGQGLTRFAQWCADQSEPWWREKLGHDSEDDSFPPRNYWVGFYQWLQWIVDEQLEAADVTARDSGMSLGLMADLAVGVHPGGSDAEALAPYLAPDCSVGAPPDGYNQMGQDWSQPPWHPWKLAEAGYRPWRDLLRTVLRHAGGIRVDHILGLFRLWWIHRPAPGEAADPRAGTYVNYDHAAMVGVLALEAERAGAVVVGEDLGTFEPWVQDYLQSRGIMGTSILWFENDNDAPRHSENYRRLCLASVTTHDLPPTAGYLDGEHVTLRQKLGILTSDPKEEDANDLEWQNRVLDTVREHGDFDGTPADVSYEGLARDERPNSAAIIAGLHKFLAESPAALTCTSLVDIVHDRRVQNQPGTTADIYPNWRVPLCDDDGNAVVLEDLFRSDEWAQSYFHSRR